ncbi:hypothetical protein Trydic_g21226 [Trypoxylus dichotomus]
MSNDCTINSVFRCLGPTGETLDKALNNGELKGDDYIDAKGHIQFPEKIGVWIGILRDQVIGALFFNGNLNCEAYLDTLENAVNSLIIDVLKNKLDRDGNILLGEDGLHLHQNEGHSHYVLLMRLCLGNVLPNKWGGTKRTYRIDSQIA